MPARPGRCTTRLRASRTTIIADQVPRSGKHQRAWHKTVYCGPVSYVCLSVYIFVPDRATIDMHHWHN